MIERIVDLSENAAHLCVRHKQFVLRPKDLPEVSFPVTELAVLILAHPQIQLTQPVLAGLSVGGGALLVCDARRLPVGMLLPLAGHHTQVARFAAQAAAPRPTNKRVWQQIVKCKIAAQSSLLTELFGDDGGLSALASQVRSGDSGNVEARAARRYWSLLFAGMQFRRRRDGDEPNPLLNYGYAVLRAIVARAVCATGLHPSLGLHHHNKYSAYPLADDLMEPLRPIVDGAVMRLADELGEMPGITKESKRAVVLAMLDRVTVQGEQRTVFDVARRMASSLAEVYLKREAKVYLPT
jgi:CRISPR-associated protein Cas1